MPVRVFYQNDPDQPCTIRPTPFVSISTNLLKNGAGDTFGVTYTITLTGTLLDNQGSPYAVKQDSQTRFPFFVTAPDSVGPYGAFDSTISHFNGRPPPQEVDVPAKSQAIFSKQKALRALFAQNGQKLEITDFNDDEATIICFPRTAQITFQEGIYVEKCDYTINIECDVLLNKDLQVDSEGSLIAYDNIARIGLREDDLLVALSGAFIENFDENWSLESDDTNGESVGIPRSYRISHSVSATGKTHFTPSGTKLSAWEQARKFVQLRLADSINDYPNVMGQIGSGTINLINSYGGFNHVRSEQISQSNGSYSVSENWLIASGSSFENFTLSTNTSLDSPYVNVSINGNIKGLSQLSPSGFGGNDASGTTAYQNALAKYNQSSNSGQFGYTCDFYKRANQTVAVQLNSQPLSIALGSNSFTGEITYSLAFNNRATNIISGVLSEDIQITDTSAADIFAIIPVIGRTYGPILQAVGGRSEYERSLSINLVLDYNQVPYGATRNPLLLKKPSVVEPTATQLANLIRELSPSQEAGVRKYFVKPSPQENWNPKNGTYSFTINWIYETST